MKQNKIDTPPAGKSLMKPFLATRLLARQANCVHTKANSPSPLLQRGGGSAAMDDSDAQSIFLFVKRNAQNTSPLVKGDAQNTSPLVKGDAQNTSPFVKGGLRGIYPMAKQQGVALVVALVLLVVVTLVGLAAIRGTSLQEKMAGNMVDRAQAFQLTEGAVDLAARTVVLATPGPSPTTYNAPGVTDCSAGPCADNPAIAIPNDSNWVTIPVSNSSNSAISNMVSLYGNTPSYLVQYMGSCTTTGGGNFKFTNDQNNQGGGGSLAPASQCYRITARGGAAGTDRSQIVVQAIYRVS
jgi:type IV pilus assembly protein PilX